MGYPRTSKTVVEPGRGGNGFQDIVQIHSKFQSHVTQELGRLGCIDSPNVPHLFYIRNLVHIGKTLRNTQSSTHLVIPGKFCPHSFKLDGVLGGIVKGIRLEVPAYTRTTNKIDGQSKKIRFEHSSQLHAE